MTKILEVTGLSRHFGDFVAVDKVSFSLSKGICFGLLGPNGAGKTTTIEMLEGILEKSGGTIAYKGKEMDKVAFNEIGIQFQNTALQDYLTVAETLTLFASFYERTQPIAHLVELCQLENFLHQDHRKLSGGQKQRLLLALALINDPDLIFLDEPTTGLDPHSRRLFWDLVNRIKADGKTILLTTHYMDEAEYLCDQIAIMDKGKIIALDTPKKLLNDHFKGAVIYLPKTSLNSAQIALFNAQVHGDHYAIYAQDVELCISQLLAQGITLNGMQIKSASLDDLFVKLTGHTLTNNQEHSHNLGEVSDV